MGTIVSLIAGVGLVLVWSSFWEAGPGSVRTRRVTNHLRDRLNQAGMHNLSILSLVTACVMLGLIAWVLVLALTGSFAIASALSVFALLAPGWYVSISARKRRTEVTVLWPEAIDDLISAIRAGMSLPEALSALGERGPAGLQPFFHQFAADYRATGRFDECLDRLKDRLADPDGDRIVEALRITRDVGGTDLTTLLTTLAQFLRKEIRTRKELQARQSWTTGGARLAAVAPWVVLALLSTRQETARAFDTPSGVLLLACGALATVVAYTLMLRIGRLPEEVRVFR